MRDIAEMDSYGMLCEDWGSAYLITRAPAAAQPRHPMYALTPYELRDYRRDLERAIKGIGCLSTTLM